MASANATLLLECGLRVLASAELENQPDEMRRFRCVRGALWNGCVLGRRWGESRG